MTSKVFNSVEDVPQDHWEQIRTRCNGPFSLGRRFLSVIETTMSDVTQLWYVLFYNKSDEPIACACISTLKVDLVSLAGSKTRNMLSWLRRLVPGSFYMDVLFCGLPVSLGHKGLLITQGANSNSVLKELDILLTDLAVDHKAKLVMLKEHGVKDLSALQYLIQRGYHQAESLSMNVFDEPFHNFDHYLSNLKSHYRYDIKRSLRKLEDYDIQIVRWTDPDAIISVYTPEIHKLYLSVVDNAETQFEILPCKFFHELARKFPDEIALLGLLKDGRILAFNWSLATESVYQFLFCGIDYEINRKMDLYFNIMYAELDYGLQSGAPEISVGQTSDQFKTRLGCQQRPLYIFVKSVSIFVRQLLKHFFSVLFPPKQQLPTSDIYNSDYNAS